MTCPRLHAFAEPPSLLAFAYSFSFKPPHKILSECDSPCNAPDVPAMRVFVSSVDSTYHSPPCDGFILDDICRSGTYDHGHIG
jgi:hypothetical protein